MELAVTEKEFPGLQTMLRQRLGDQIADILRKKILLAELAPGQNIAERETAEALGVSRTPLREALLILEGEGLVKTAPAKSPIVANPSVEDITQLLLVQVTLEGLAGECACENMTDDEFSQIQSMHENMVAKADQAEALDFFSSDMAFHEAIVTAAKNQPLMKTYAQYNSRLWRVRFMSSRRRIKKRSITLQEHANIVEGLKLRDKEQTSAALASHLRRAIANIAFVIGIQENHE